MMLGLNLLNGKKNKVYGSFERPIVIRGYHKCSEKMRCEYCLNILLCNLQGLLFGVSGSDGAGLVLNDWSNGHLLKLPGTMGPVARSYNQRRCTLLWRPQEKLSLLSSRLHATDYHA